MRSTLFLIPHQIGGIPLFGFGLLLAILSVGCVGWCAWALSKKTSMADLFGALPAWAIAVAIVVFLLPNVELRLADGTPLGLPIRGYGVMVLLGLLAGIGITIRRGQQLKITADTIVGLGFWMMLGGIIGARAFYVVQKWEADFGNLAPAERLIGIVKLTEGGLVIYGGVVGGLLAGAVYCLRHRLKLAATADLIAPGFLIGLSFGRIGCLLHGCCFGGVCVANLPSIQFPKGSVPYYHQLETGQLLGIELQERRQPPGTIVNIVPGSPAELARLKTGQVLNSVSPGLAEELTSPTTSPVLRADTLVDGMPKTFMPEQLPERSLPVHPSQIYASINALLLCLLVWHIQPRPRHDGVAFLIAILLYALSRFLLEGVRSDEVGQLGTPFTIAQLVAMGSGAAAVVGLWIVSKSPSRRAWSWPRS